MISLSLPRHEPFQRVGYEINHSIFTVNTRSPYDGKWKEFTYPAINRFFKSNIVKSDRVIPTTYGRLTTYSRLGAQKYDYLVGGYKANGVLKYLAPNYALSTSSAFSNLYQIGPSIKYDINEENRAIAQATAKIMSDDMNISATVAEARETAGYLGEATLKAFLGTKAILTGNRKQLKQLFSDASRALTHAKLDLKHNELRQIKKTLRKGVRNVPRSLGGRFLEYKFAIAPLIMEVEGLHRIMRNGLMPSEYEESPWLIMTKSATVKEIVRDWKTNNDLTQLHEQYKRIHYVNYTFRIDNAPLFALAVIGATNVAGGFWEATRFSWLVDYLLPIGTFLQALNARLGTVFVRGYKGVAISGFITEKSYNKYGWSEPAYLTLTGFERNKLNGFPTVLPYVKSPFSSNNIQNVTALAAALIPYKSK